MSLKPLESVQAADASEGKLTGVFNRRLVVRQLSCVYTDVKNLEDSIAEKISRGRWNVWVTARVGRGSFEENVVDFPGS